MEAAVLHEAGRTPVVEEFDDPEGDVVEVRVAGCNPVDLLMASGAVGEPTTPSVVGQDGIGITADGQRVYFNSRPIRRVVGAAMPGRPGQDVPGARRRR